MSNMDIGHLDPNLFVLLKDTIDKLLTDEKMLIEENQQVDENNVFQKARTSNRTAIFPFLENLLEEESGIVGKDNWVEFYDNYKKGKSSLILAEHKSNLDVLLFNYLMVKDSPELKKNFEEIVFIAGRKLNEESLFVKLFAEMYNRLIVVPKSESQDSTEEELKNIFKINYATQLFLKEHLHDHIYLIYPTGTRSRYWEPETYVAITETVNYLKKFDQVIFLAVDGNCMFPVPNIMMDSEPLINDKIVLRFSKPVSTKAFIEEKEKEYNLSYDPKDKLAQKAYIAKSISDTIYNQKPVPPWEENWVAISKKLLKNI